MKLRNFLRSVCACPFAYLTKSYVSSNQNVDGYTFKPYGDSQFEVVFNKNKKLRHPLVGNDLKGLLSNVWIDLIVDYISTGGEVYVELRR